MSNELKNLPCKDWFIRTKNKNIIFGEDDVPWLQNFSQEKIQLLALGPEISTRFYPVGGLLTKGKIARHAFEMINALIGIHEKIDQQDKKIHLEVNNLILTSDKLELIVVTNILPKTDQEIKNEGKIYIWKPSRDFKNVELEKLNWTSAIFASLAYKLIAPDDISTDFRETLKKQFIMLISIAE